MSTAHIGARVAQARRERGLTQAQLAGAINFSLPLVKAVEQGRVPASHAFTTAVVRTLGLELGWLLGQDQIHRHNREGDPTAAVVLRAAIDAYDDPQLPGAVRPLAELESMFTDTERWWRTGRYDRMSLVLPDLLRHLYVHVRDAPPGTAHAERAHALLADTYSHNPAAQRPDRPQPQRILVGRPRAGISAPRRPGALPRRRAPGPSRVPAMGAIPPWGSRDPAHRSRPGRPGNRRTGRAHRLDRGTPIDRVRAGNGEPSMQDRLANRSPASAPRPTTDRLADSPAAVVTPEWVRHAVFYQIFPDRFAKSDSLEKPHNLESWDSDPTPFGYKGGDLAGVRERLDYLQDLGVTALYFNPIFQSASNHRYHTHDYYKVDPLLGGDQAFDALLTECRRRGLRIVLDGVFNHASRGFFPFNDVLENGPASPWLDWFTVHEHPANAYDHTRPPSYEAWVGLHALPKLNTDNPRVREYLMRVGEYWVGKGIDGWRLDVPSEIGSDGFWQEFRQRIKAINPEAYLVGEVWTDGRPWLQGDQFDGVMNYLFAEAAIAFSAGHRVRRDTVEDRSYAPWPGIDGRAYAAKIDHLLRLYPWPIQLTQLNLLDSHDTSRFISIAGDDRASVRLGTLLLFTFPGAPSIYYGDEIGLTGALPPDCWARRTFPWDHPQRWDCDTLACHKTLIALRRAHPVLRTGDYTCLHADPDVYAFARTLTDSTLITAVNVAEVARRIEIPLTDPRTSTILFATDGSPTAEPAPRGLVLTLPARSGVVLDASPTAHEGDGRS